MKHVPNGPIARPLHTVVGNTAVNIDGTVNENDIHYPILREIQNCISHSSELNLPIGIRPHLEALAKASHPEFYAEHEHAYWELYRESVELCRQGWHSFNYWVSAEQTTCYRIYWDLKRIADKYEKPLIIEKKPVSLIEQCENKIKQFFKQIIHFLHLHELEYYQWIAPSKEPKKKIEVIKINSE